MIRMNAKASMAIGLTDKNFFSIGYILNSNNKKIRVYV